MAEPVVLGLAPPRDWPTLGWGVVDWMESRLCHGPGDVEGEPWVLDDEQTQFILDAYRLYPPEHERAGRRVVFDATYSRPKGRAKSELAGGLACAEAKGPVRFAGWDRVGPNGELVGKPVRSPVIRCLATEEGQAGNTYDNVRVMLEHAKDGPFGSEFANVDIGKTRVLVGSTGVITPSSAGAASKDGGKETFAVADETHLYVLPEHRAMFGFIRRNLRKRRTAEPWIMATTTMYRPGQASIAEGRHEAAYKSVGNPARDVSVLFDHREGPQVVDWDDDGLMLTALEAAYGEFAKVMDMTGLVSEIRDPETDRGDAQRYFLNQRAEFADTAFNLDTWDAAADVDGSTGDRDLITVGFDGARFDDATAVVACDVATGRLWLAGLWERPLGVDGWQVPDDEVTDCVRALFEQFDVWRLYADPPYWESTIAQWSAEFGEKRVIEWWTNRNKQMVYACRSFRTALETGTIRHDGSSDLRRHIGNAYREDMPRLKDDQGRSMWRIRKERAGSPRKMDAAMAAVLAWEARTDAVTSGATGRRKFQPPIRMR